MFNRSDASLPLNWSAFNIERFGPASTYRYDPGRRDYGHKFVVSAGLNPYSRADLFWFIYGMQYVTQALHDLAIAYHQPEFYDAAQEAIIDALPDVLSSLVPFVPKVALDGATTACRPEELAIKNNSLWLSLEGAVARALQFYVYPESGYVKERADARRDYMQRALQKPNEASRGAICRCLLGAKSFVNLVSGQYDLGGGSDAQLRMALAQVAGDFINYTPEWLRQSALPKK